MKHPVLASSSPRRQELLALAGVGFETVPAGVDETPRDDEPPDAYVARMARMKAETVAAGLRDPRPVLGADTAVVVDGRILGKPADTPAAAAMLKLLSGRAHEVLSAVALVDRDGTHELLTRTRVVFRALGMAEIEAYCRGGEPYDKAGAYAIQGAAAAFVERVEGSYTGVVGLPLSETIMLLERRGYLDRTS